MREQNVKNLLTAESLQLFLGTLNGLGNEEVNKAKELYIRNAISDYVSSKEYYKNFNRENGCFMLIPVFWPVLLARKNAHKIELKETKSRIINALEVWKEDLGDKYFELVSKLENIN